jgi:hypothetical protein
MNMKIEQIRLSDIEVSHNNVRLSDPMKDCGLCTISGKMMKL